jgi:hypothetical protein
LRSDCDKGEMANHSTLPVKDGGKAGESKRMCGFCKGMTIEVPRGADGQPLKDKSNQLIPSPTKKKARHPEFAIHLPPGEPNYGKISLFTAGSIEMGAAVPWQSRLIEHLEHLPITISNPRKDYWDPTIDVKSKDINFRTQVEWEMNALKAATVICFFFDTDTISPVTLMELGMWASSGKALVCCGGKYWRSGNVDIVCDRYNIPRVDSFEMLIPAVEEFLAIKGMVLDKNGNLEKGDVKPTELEMAEGKQWWLKYRDPEKLKTEVTSRKQYADWKAEEAEKAKI